MSRNARIHEDAFNLLCGDFLGSGIHRKVFVCRLRDDLVVKVEDVSGYDDNWRYFSNVHEMKFWNDYEHAEKIARWLAPCRYLSPDGRILLQDRVEPIPRDHPLPDKLPAFLTDIKRANFGLLKGQLVCVDYSSTIGDAPLRLKKVEW